MVSRNAIVPSEMAFRLVPEILDAIDMVSVSNEGVRVVDPHVAKLGDVQGVLRSERVRVDDAVRFDSLTEDGNECLRLRIWDHDCINAAPTLQKSKDRNLSSSSSATLSFANTTETAFIDFDFTGHERRFRLYAFGDHFSEFMKE